VSTTSIGRNIEMGFSPDGGMLVNFDLSDVGLQAWRLPRLTNVLLPAWMHEGDITFVPGARFVKRYTEGELSVARWPTGTTMHSIPAERTLRLRQLSADGRHGIAHRLVGASEALEWIDFVRQERKTIAVDLAGNIDNAAIAKDLTEAAWVSRGNTSGVSDHRVVVHRRAAPPVGNP
jgi:hypothetical protein